MDKISTATTNWYPKRPMPAWPQYLHVKEKHGEYAFLIRGFDELGEVALQILTARYKDGYWYYKNDIPATFEEFFLKQNKITIEEAEVLKKMGNDKIVDDCKRHYRQLLEENEDHDNMVKAIEEKNGRAAWRFLSNRSGEYESISLESFENV
jgi:predicted FMN-binding regulatory protein PaiB